MVAVAPELPRLRLYLADMALQAGHCQEAADQAERAMAIIMFLLAGALAGAVYFAIMRWQQAKPSLFSGLIMALALVTTGEAFFATAKAVIAAHLVLMVVEGAVAAACIGWNWTRPEIFEAWFRTIAGRRLQIAGQKDDRPRWQSAFI